MEKTIKEKLIEQLQKTKEKDLIEATNRWIGLDSTDEGVVGHIENYISILKEYETGED